MAMNSGKHSERDTEHSEHYTEPACFVIFKLLKKLTHRKLHFTAWST